MKAAKLIFGFFASLVFIAGAMVVGLLKGIIVTTGKSSKPSKNSSSFSKIKRQQKSTWWDYDRNVLDNDIEQLDRDTKRIMKD